MSDIMSDISTGIDKVVNDVAIASKAAQRLVWNF